MRPVGRLIEAQRRQHFSPAIHQLPKPDFAVSEVSRRAFETANAALYLNIVPAFADFQAFVRLVSAQSLVG